MWEGRGDAVSQAEKFCVCVFKIYYEGRITFFTGTEVTQLKGTAESSQKRLSDINSAFFCRVKTHYDNSFNDLIAQRR